MAVKAVLTGSAGRDNNHSYAGKSGVERMRSNRSEAVEHGVEFLPGETDHGRPAMRTGKGVLHHAELIDDSLALLAVQTVPAFTAPRQATIRMMRSRLLTVCEALYS